MGCILKRTDYLDLADQAGAAAGPVTDRVIELSACLQAGMDQDQRRMLAEIEELTVLEAVRAQDALARLLCGCPECRGQAGEHDTSHTLEYPDSTESWKNLEAIFANTDRSLSKAIERMLTEIYSKDGAP